MICYANPIFGNDATAQPDSRSHPWKTVEAAEAALRAAKQAAKEAGQDAGKWQVILTYKPLPPA